MWQEEIFPKISVLSRLRKKQIWKKQREELAESEKKLVLAETKKQEEQVLEQELKDAESLGADAIVGMRYASASVMQGAAEVIAYGTAVKFV